MFLVINAACVNLTKFSQRAEIMKRYRYIDAETFCQQLLRWLSNYFFFQVFNFELLNSSATFFSNFHGFVQQNKPNNSLEKFIMRNVFYTRQGICYWGWSCPIQLYILKIAKKFLEIEFSTKVNWWVLILGRYVVSFLKPK